MPADRPDIGSDRAVVDRIVDGVTALLLVGQDEHELHLPAEHLPQGATEGTWVVLDLGCDPPRVVRIDEELTEVRSGDLRRRIDRIRERRRGGRFSR